MTNTTKMLLVAGLMLALIVGATYALADDAIRECTQPDGSVVYTNKAKMGCTDILLPKVSIAPTRTYFLPAVPEEPALTTQTTTTTQQSNNASVEVCEKYREWMKLQMRTSAGFQHNSIEDTQNRLAFTTLFGSGYPPMGC